jgi:hypothetical protein
MKETRFFLGNNSSRGFVSYFDSFIDPGAMDRIFILKGGPGVGKSTFMKKFGAFMQSRGLDAEYIHCSGDNDSLDGVVIPELKVMLVDGTAPHTVDPALPGAADEIINLGEYFDSFELAKSKREIIRMINEKSALYQSAYRFIECAGTMQREISANYGRYTDEAKLSQLIEDAAAKVFPRSAAKPKKEGITKKLFTEAYTPSGYVSYTDLFCENRKVIGLVGENADAASKLLSRLALEAEKRGLDAIRCYMPIFPDKLQHLVLPELDIVVKSAESASSSDFDEIFDLRQVMDHEKLQACSSEIEDDQQIFRTLIDKATEKLAAAIKQHRLLESIYVKNMDFKGVDKCFDRLIGRFM